MEEQLPGSRYGKWKVSGWKHAWHVAEHRQGSCRGSRQGLGSQVSLPRESGARDA